ncbi:MAG: hypothetical protein Kow0099_03910 [Candidatus Abyssubacteria bacterium]
MKTYAKRLRQSILRNQLLDRELDYLPSTVDRDEVREIARIYGPPRRRSYPARFAIGVIDFVARYSAPFIGMIVGAEYEAARALYPLIGKEERFGEALRIFLGEEWGQRVEDTGKAFKVTGTLVAATPDIIYAALYGALLGIIAYIVLKWSLIAGGSFRRRMKLRRKIVELLG